MLKPLRENLDISFINSVIETKPDTKAAIKPMIAGAAATPKLNPPDTNCQRLAPIIKGIEIKNENCAALVWSLPSILAVAIVVPLRDIPGMPAAPCAIPIIVASKNLIELSFASGRALLFVDFLVLTRLLTNKIIAVITKQTASHCPSKLDSNKPRKIKKIMTVGKVATIIDRFVFCSGFLISGNNVFRITIITASSVAKCVSNSKPSPVIRPAIIW